MSVVDWTSGGDAILFQRCASCAATWYFVRGFCPRCGRAEPQTRPAAGSGVVHAVTLVERAPSAELRALAPYGILLVDMSEGFRMMTQGEKGLAIGDEVRVRIEAFAGRRVPFAERAT
jgi:uncharacterized OB-fold protein